MKRSVILIAVAFSLMSACVAPEPMSQEPGPILKTVQESVITGTNENYYFSLSEEVFKVSRPKFEHLLLVALYLPLVFMRRSAGADGEWHH